VKKYNSRIWSLVDKDKRARLLAICDELKKHSNPKINLLEEVRWGADKYAPTLQTVADFLAETNTKDITKAIGKIIA